MTPPTDASAVLAACLKARQHVGPKRLAAPGPDEAALRQMFEAAAQAPDHGCLRPWRFVVLGPAARSRLGEAFAQALRERDPAATEAQLADARDKAARGPVLILALADLRADNPQVPAEERLVSLGAAIQNLLLSAQALGFDSGLSSGRALQSQPLRQAFALAEGEQAICCITLGTAVKRKPPRERPAVEAFVRWQA